MTSRDFCYWLQGFFEIHGEGAAQLPTLDQDQVRCIKSHLAMVFVHEIDPSMGPPAHQAKLDEIHVGDKKPAGASTVGVVPHSPTTGGHPWSPGHGNPTFRC